MGETRKARLERCDICGEAGNRKKLVICSLCKDNTEHIYCMRNELNAVPDEWFCEACCSNRRASPPKNGIHASDHPKAPLLSRNDRFEAPSTKLNQNFKMQSSCGMQGIVKNGSSEGVKNQTLIQRNPCESTELSNDDDMQLIELMKPLSAGGNLFNKIPNKGKKVDNPVIDSPSSKPLSRGCSFKKVETAKVKFLPVNDVVSLASGAKTKQSSTQGVSDSIPSVSVMASADVCSGGSANAGSKFFLQKENMSSCFQSGNSKVVDGIPAFLPSSEPEGSAKKDGLVIKLLRVKEVSHDATLTARNKTGNLNTETEKQVVKAADASIPARETMLNEKQNPVDKCSTHVRHISSLNTESEKWVYKAPLRLSQVKEEITENLDAKAADVPLPARETIRLNTEKEKPVDKCLAQARQVSDLNTESEKRVYKAPLRLSQVKEEIKENWDANAAEVPLPARETIRLNTKKEKPVDKSTLHAREIGNLSTESEKQVDRAPLRLLHVKEEIMEKWDAKVVDAPLPARETIQLKQIKEEVTAAAASSGKIGNLNSDKGKEFYEASVFSLLPLNPFPACAGNIFSIDAKVNSLDGHQKDLQQKLFEISHKMLQNLPVPCALWRGSFEIIDMVQHSHLYDGLQAHLPNRVSPKARALSEKLPENMQFHLLPRQDVWPKPFLKYPPTDEDIALYILPSELDRSKEKYLRLLDLIMEGDFAMINCFDGAELLIFTSKQISVDCQRLNMNMYLWGVFRPAKRNKVSTPSYGISRNSVHVTNFHNYEVAKGINDGKMDKIVPRPNMDKCEVMGMKIDMAGDAGKMDKIVPRLNTEITLNGPLRSKLEDLSVTLSAGLIQDSAEPRFPPGFSQPVPDMLTEFSQPLWDIPPGFSEPTVDISPGSPKLQNLRHYEVSAHGYKSFPGVDSVSINPKPVPEIKESKSMGLTNLTSSEKKDDDKGLTRETVRTEGSASSNMELERNRFLHLPRSEGLTERSEGRMHHHRSDSHRKSSRDKVAGEIESEEESYRKRGKRRKMYESEGQNKRHRYGGYRRHHSESYSHSRRGTTDEEIDKTKDNSRKTEKRLKGIGGSRADSENQRNHNWSHSSCGRSIDSEDPAEIQKSIENLRKLEEEGKRLLSTSRDGRYRESSQSVRNNFERQLHVDGDIAKEAVKTKEQSPSKLELSQRSLKDHSGSQSLIIPEADKMAAKEAVKTVESFRKTEDCFWKMAPGRNGLLDSGKTVESLSNTALEQGIFSGIGETVKEFYSKIEEKRERLLDVPSHENFTEISQSQRPRSENLPLVQTETDKVLAEATLETEESRRNGDHWKKLQDTPKQGSFFERSWNPSTCSGSQSDMLIGSNKVVKDAEKSKAISRKPEQEKKKFLDTVGPKIFFGSSTHSENQSHIPTSVDKVVEREASPRKKEQEKKKILDTLVPESFVGTSRSPWPRSESLTDISVAAGRDGLKETAKVVEDKNFRNSYQNRGQAMLPSRGISYLQLFPTEMECKAPRVVAKNLEFDLELGIGQPARNKITFKWESPTLGLSTHWPVKEGEEDQGAITEEHVWNGGHGDEVKLNLRI